MAPSSSPAPKRSRSCAQRTDTAQLNAWKRVLQPDRPVAQRAGRCVVAVPGGSRAVADLWRHPHRQLCARLVLHAGPVCGLHAGGAAVGQHRLLARAAAGALATGVLGAVVEMALLRRIYRAPDCCNCWPPSRWCWSSKTRCCGPGALKSCLAPRAGAGGLWSCILGRPFPRTTCC